MGVSRAEVSIHYDNEPARTARILCDKNPLKSGSQIHRRDILILPNWRQLSSSPPGEGFEFRLTIRVQAQVKLRARKDQNVKRRKLSSCFPPSRNFRLLSCPLVTQCSCQTREPLSCCRPGDRFEFRPTIRVQAQVRLRARKGTEWQTAENLLLPFPLSSRFCSSPLMS